MKNLIRKLSLTLALALTLSFILPNAIPIFNFVKVAEAAAIKINMKELTLFLGETYNLKVTGTKATIKWTSSNTSVVKVSTKGKISAIKKGTATITATVSKKKYTCIVTVKEQVPTVSYLADRSVQYEKLDQCHLLLFSLQDDNNNRIASDATIDIEIVNDNGETVYSKSHQITSSNFGNWTSAFYGERFLASVYISDTDIISGSSKKGTIYFTVYNEGNFAFDESKLTIDNLPYISAASSCSINLPSLPITATDYSYSGKIQSTIDIESIQYEFEESYDGKTVNLTIYFTGAMTYNNSTTTSYGHIGYKLYKDGYVVKSGTHLTPQLSSGDKFKNSDESFYGLEPGVYTLEVLSTN
jgi:hypothetical protein